MNDSWQDFLAAQPSVQTAGVILFDRLQPPPSLEVFEHHLGQLRSESDVYVTAPEAARDFCERFRPEPQNWDAIRQRESLGDLSQTDLDEWVP